MFLSSPKSICFLSQKNNSLFHAPFFLYLREKLKRPTQLLRWWRFDFDYPCQFLSQNQWNRLVFLLMVGHTSNLSSTFTSFWKITQLCRNFIRKTSITLLFDPATNWPALSTQPRDKFSMLLSSSLIIPESKRPKSLQKPIIMLFSNF